MPDYEIPEIAQGAASGESLLKANAATEMGGIKKYLARYGVQAPEFLAMAQGNMDRATTNALQNMFARLGEVQLRSQLRQQYLDAKQREFDVAQRSKKRGMWGSALGALGQMGGGILSMFKPKAKSTWSGWFGNEGVFGMGEED